MARLWQASIYFPTVLQNLGMYNMNFADKAAKDHFKTTGRDNYILKLADITLTLPPSRSFGSFVSMDGRFVIVTATHDSA